MFLGRGPGVTLGVGPQMPLQQILIPERPLAARSWDFLWLKNKRARPQLTSPTGKLFQVAVTENLVIMGAGHL